MRDQLNAGTSHTLERAMQGSFPSRARKRSVSSATCGEPMMILCCHSVFQGFSASHAFVMVEYVQ